MDPKFRVVPDINTAVSGYLWVGPSRRVIDAALAGTIRLVTTDELVRQLGMVLRRPKLASRLHSTDSDAETLLRVVRARFEVVEPAAAVAPTLRDQRDLPVLAAAVGGHADLIVTGDKDLLVLREFQGIGIVTPVELLRTLGLD